MHDESGQYFKLLIKGGGGANYAEPELVYFSKFLNLYNYNIRQKVYLPSIK